MAILQASLDGKKSQPSDGELDRVVTRINSGENWRQIFPGVATLTIGPEGNGPGLSLRIMKKEGEAVQIVPVGTPDSTVVAVMRVNELDFYSLGVRDLARKFGVNETHLLWLIRRDRMQEDADFFKAIRIGKSTLARHEVQHHPPVVPSRRIPPLAELQLIDYFGHRFFVVDYPIETSGRPCLARLARSYIRR